LTGKTVSKSLHDRPEKIVAAMLSRTIAAFCIIDDALQAMGYKDDPQAKTPASAILTLAVLGFGVLGVGSFRPAPRVEEGDGQALKVAGVPGHQDQTVVQRRGGQHGV
jgi:hypothetical protein